MKRLIKITSSIESRILIEENQKFDLLESPASPEQFSLYP